MLYALAARVLVCTVARTGSTFLVCTPCGTQNDGTSATDTSSSSAAITGVKRSRTRSSKKAAESGDLQKSLADGRLADIYRDFHGAQYDPRSPKTELRKNSGPENGQPRGMLTGLSAMQKSIMDRNSSGAFGNAYLSPFGDFTPQRFEVAVSL